MQVYIRPAYEELASHYLPDVRIIIDVFRASTTTLTILESGAKKLLIANEYDVIQKLSLEGYLVVSEVFDLGIDNSPTLVKKYNLHDRQVVLKTSNLTTALEQNWCENTIICCFNNLAAVVQKINLAKYQIIEIIPAGYMSQKVMNLEDIKCAETLKKSLEKNEIIFPDLAVLEEHVKNTCALRPRPQHYIEDLALAIQSNISSVVPYVKNAKYGLYEIDF